MLTIHADEPFTRRKSFHHIRDGGGITQASFTTMSDVFDWCIENDHRSIILKTEENIYKIDLTIWE